ncbi:hypothetical protein ACFW2Y_13745 [Streptomyces sp. NPDC058877]|uniref:hypothetical protein n=1 Tax=Streptomyces sp. NPDC058877 TaxID=3346665 RepID=UPI0036921D1A
MGLNEGQRVKLAVDLRLTGQVVPAGETAQEAGAGFLALAAGAEGTVERVDADRPQGHEVREYERLGSLLDAFGHQMPPASREQVADQVAALRPAWVAHQERKLRLTVRVRFDNGFVLDDAPGDLFVSP